MEYLEFVCYVFICSSWLHGSFELPLKNDLFGGLGILVINVRQGKTSLQMDFSLCQEKFSVQLSPFMKLQGAVRPLSHCQNWLKVRGQCRHTLILKKG